MKLCTNFVRSLSLVMGAGFLSLAHASTVSVNDFASQPPFLQSASEPLVMFAMSNDHEMWKKA